MRGRLVDPFLCEISRIDTAATAALDPDGAGPLTSGYDADFKEPTRTSNATAQGSGTVATVYKTAVRIRAQVEVGTFEKMQAFFTGNSPDIKMVLISHFKELERAAMVDANGRAMLRVGDRLDGIYTLKGQLVQIMTTPLFCVQPEGTSYGIGLHRNLLALYFEARSKAVQP